ncbi:MAG TPA: ATP-dependent zinc metalloprotease FtsH, partial [Spirochaetes bacterium]|nr:ATP-dependent zinc metalloprotease FtsH [Spirochaetota bacterium]
VRGAGYGGGHDEREQTLNQMLVEMDGFDTDETVIIMAATNRPDVLDPALLRPGRFDRRVIVGSPDVKGREKILAIHMKKVPFAKSVDTATIARGTPGFSGADLANLVNEAALIAARREKKKVQMEDFEYAKDKVLMGPERKSMVISDNEKVNTAYHEAGHALLAYLLPKVNPVHKVSIIPRGNALGITQTLPEEERHTYSKEYLLEEMMVLFGGRISEEYKFGSGGITNGASNDIEKGTKIARSMVCEWGMSDTLGPITYGQKEEPIFIGKEIAQHKDYSEKTAEMIDKEIKSIVGNVYIEAKKVIMDNVKKLETLAQALLTREVLDRQEILELIGDNGNLKDA